MAVVSRENGSFAGTALRRGRRRPSNIDSSESFARDVETFIERKKIIALMLSALLFGIAASNLVQWCVEVFSVVRFDAVPTIDVRTIFYLDLFTVMIFADAIILILSLLLSGHYALVFRNAAFVVSTILLRFSLAVRKPYDVELGLVSIAFGTLVLLAYNYYLRFSVDARSSAEPPTD